MALVDKFRIVKVEHGEYEWFVIDQWREGPIARFFCGDWSRWSDYHPSHDGVTGGSSTDRRFETVEDAQATIDRYLANKQPPTETIVETLP